MRLRTFEAATMAEAMRNIRSELGEDAVIISSQSKRGGRGVRIVAAVDGTDLDEAAYDGWAGEEPGPAEPEGEVRRVLAYHGPT
jgi:flagellar biosynthesis protein FlhF